MATGMGETLHRSPRNAESFRIKRRAFRLVPPDGGLLVAHSVVDLLRIVEANDVDTPPEPNNVETNCENYL